MVEFYTMTEIFTFYIMTEENTKNIDLLLINYSVKKCVSRND